ncbi:MAG: AAA family ATPase [Acidobacteria bacterium]|nr:MAG: AAA family ATPase [Acidobacteriota bacterium]
MFPRTILGNLEKWANKLHRKPLILRGARQVGKTTAIDLFSREFDQYLKLNLEKLPDRKLFEQNLSVKELLQAIRLHLNQPMLPGRILLFIDEIQNSPEAIHAMRYFYEEENPNLYVVSAGSLLETLIAKGNISFPVGRVEYQFMWPLSFSEFLRAEGLTEAYECFHATPIPGFAHEILLKEFRRYMFIGGMPEIVSRYIETDDITSLSPIYQSLLISFQDDVEKYARSGAAAGILRHAIKTLPFEAGKRIHFHGFGNSNYGSREMGEALRTLEKAMLLHLLYPTTATQLPLIPNRKRSPRLQFLDTGLLCSALGLQGGLFEAMELNAVYNGILAEHIVGQELLGISDGSSVPVFWVREKRQANAEVDFLLKYKSQVIPVEIKSGKPGILRSLHAFIEQSGARIAVRLYSGGFHVQEAITPVQRVRYTLYNLPLYMASRLPEYLG